MSDVIDFLERMGADAQLRQTSEEDVVLALEEAELEPSFCVAILARDSSQLHALLRQEPLIAMQTPGPGEDEEEEEEEGDEEGDGDGEQIKPKQSAASFTTDALPVLR